MKKRGRKTAKPGDETVTVALRMGMTQRAKLGLLGGAKWVRARIDRAKIKGSE